MERDAAIRCAKTFLSSKEILFGDLRFAHFMWDFECSLGIGRNLYVNHMFGVTPRVYSPWRIELIEKWLIVFDPTPAKEAEHFAECLAVLIDDHDEKVDGYYKYPGRYNAFSRKTMR